MTRGSKTCHAEINIKINDTLSCVVAVNPGTRKIQNSIRMTHSVIPCSNDVAEWKLQS